MSTHSQIELLIYLTGSGNYSAIFQLNYGENKLIFNEVMMTSALFWTNMPSLIFIVLAH